MTNDTIAIVYSAASDGQKGKLAFYDAFGAKIGGAIEFAAFSDAFDAVGLANGNVLIAYGTPDDVSFAVYDAAGALIAEPLAPLSSGSQSQEFAVGQLSGGNILVTWSEDIGGGTFSSYYAVVEPDGNVVKAKTELSAEGPSGGAFGSAVAPFGNDTALVAYAQGSTAGRFAIIDDAGTISSGPTTFLSSFTTSIAAAPAGPVNPAGGSVVVSGRDAGGGNTGLYFVIGSTGTVANPGGTEFIAGLQGEAGATQLQDGSVLLAFEDLGTGMAPYPGTLAIVK